MTTQPIKAGVNAGFFARQPVWALAFRPLYLLAAAFAALAVPLWLASYLNAWPILPRVGLDWHMHEMVFGFALAVVVGFLFTAGRNWTGLQTARHGVLAAFCALWLAGRIAMLWAPRWLAALVDLPFLPCAAYSFFCVLKAAGNWRNMFAVGLLVLLSILNLLFHAAGAGQVAVSQVTLIQAAILIVVLIVSLIGGRVIPMFTRNMAGSAPSTNSKLDKVALAALVLAGLCWVAGAWPWLTAAAATAAGCAQGYRLFGWKPLSTLPHPLLWILHVSYAWIGVGLLLLALAALGKVPASSAFHALALGAMSGMIIGMITRTALGHTARPMQAGRAETVMFALVQGGALARLIASLMTGTGRDHALLLSALCWSCGFMVYLWVYAPYLTRARLDGAEG